MNITSRTGPRFSAMTSVMSVMLCFTSFVSSTAQGNTQRVRFERGHSSTIVKGTIAGFDVKDYVIGAKADQQMTLHLTASNPSTYFVIQSINGRANDMNETDEWSERLTESGDYVIRVFMMRSAARRKGAVSNFSLKISIQ